jgi:hypothetical protein
VIPVVALAAALTAIDPEKPAQPDARGAESPRGGDVPCGCFD